MADFSEPCCDVFLSTIWPQRHRANVAPHNEAHEPSVSHYALSAGKLCPLGQQQNERVGHPGKPLVIGNVPVPVILRISSATSFDISADSVKTSDPLYA